MNPDSAARTAILVLGMHRSGTSALAGCLHRLGVALGEPLLPADSGNERGYWEHAEVVDLHDRLLSSFGLSPVDPAPLPTSWLGSEDARRAAEELSDIIARRFAALPIWAVKDPRLSLLLPLWRSPLERAGVTPRAALVQRSPWEVARSLAVRDLTPRARALAAWGRFVGDAERNSRGIPRSFTTYESLLAEPVAQLERLARETGVEWPVAPAAASGSLLAFLNPSLRHWKEDAAPSTLRTSAEVAASDAWETLRSLSRRAEGPGDGTRLQEVVAPLVRLGQAERSARRVVLVLPRGTSAVRAAELATIFQEDSEPGRTSLRFVVEEAGETARSLVSLGDVAVRAGGVLEPGLTRDAAAVLRVDPPSPAAAAAPGPPGPAAPLPDAAFQVEWLGCRLPGRVCALDPFEAEVTIRNASAHAWPFLDRSERDRDGFYAVRLSYRLVSEDGAETLTDDRSRVDLPWGLGPGDVARVRVRVLPPRRPGSYRLRLRLLQELVAWFEAKGAADLEVPLVVER